MPRIYDVKSGLACAFACLIAITGGCDDDGAADDAHGDHGDHGSEPHTHDGNTPIGPLTGAECPDDSTLTYENFGKPFMQKFCLGCHSRNVTGDARKMAPADHNFDTYAEIDLLAMHIDQRAGSGPDRTNTTMPPANVTPTPSLDERKQLSEWIACGWPE